MHDATLRSDDCIGAVEISLENLLKQNQRAYVYQFHPSQSLMHTYLALDLEDKKPLKDKRLKSTLAVQLTCSNPVETAERALGDAKQDILTLPKPLAAIDETVSAAETTAGVVEGAQEIVSSNSLLQSALGAVVARLEVLVPILDKIATVSRLRFQ